MKSVSSLSPHRALRSLAAFCLPGSIPLKAATLCGVLAAAGIVSPALWAQTAYFAGATTTLPGSFTGANGVAVDKAGDVFVADYDTSKVSEIVAVGGVVLSSSSTVNTVSNSSVSHPGSVAVDGSGDVFFTSAAAVYEIEAGTGGAEGGTVNSNSTVITVGSGFSGPDGVAVDGSGDVFVADAGANAVYEIEAGTGGAASGTVNSSSTVTSLGIILGDFSSPGGVAVDGNGDVFVADSGHSEVKEIVASGGLVSAISIVNIVGSGFSGPDGVAVDGSGDVVVADTGNSAVKEIVAVGGAVSASSTVNTLGSGFSEPQGVAVGGNGDVFVADTGNGAVKEIQFGGVNFGSLAVNTTTPATLTLLFTIESAGILNAPVVLPQGATSKDFTDATTGTCTNGASFVEGSTCTVNVTFTPTLPGQRLGAVQLMSSGGAVIATANVYGMGTGPLVTFPSNTAVNLVGSGIFSPNGVAVDGSGDVFVADTGQGVVNEIVAVGGVVSAASTVKVVGHGFGEPWGVAVDGSGDIFVADTGYNAVKEIVAVGGAVSASSTVNTLGSFTLSPTTTALR